MGGKNIVITGAVFSIAPGRALLQAWIPAFAGMTNQGAKPRNRGGRADRRGFAGIATHSMGIPRSFE
jgi:hypothetical protein